EQRRCRRRLLDLRAHQVPWIAAMEIAKDVVDWMLSQRLRGCELVAREDVDSKVKGFTPVSRVRYPRRCHEQAGVVPRRRGLGRPGSSRFESASSWHCSKGPPSG